MLSFEHVEFDYEPYPLAVLRPVFDKAVYEELLANWPDEKICRQVGGPGHKLYKFSLDESWQPQHRDFVKSHPIWWKLLRYTKSEKFLRSTLRLLRANGIELGYEALLSQSANSWWRPRVDRARELMGRDPKLTAGFRTRLQISTLPAQGGRVMPHTDNLDRIATFVIHMPVEGEWDQDWGGGLDVCRPRNPARGFNVINRKGVFDEVDVVRTIPYRVNQGVLIVKTFNSWHSVRPITCPDPSVVRRSITLSINRLTIPSVKAPSSGGA